MANRFTQYSPREFQQTYDPLPMDQMIQLGQIGQRRNDAIDSAIGAAAGDLTFEGGLATQGLASNMTKEYNDQLKALSDSWNTNRNSSAVIQGLSKLKQQMASDPRKVTLDSDKALKPFILANMNKPEYGKSLQYKAYDDQTGQFNIGDIDSIVGRNVTPADYGLMENVADLKAYSPYIDRVKPLIDDQYTLVDNPETGQPEYRHKQTNKKLDYQTVKSRSEDFLNSFKNEDGTINMEALNSIDPEMAKNAAWKMHSMDKEGRTGQYNWDSLMDNYMNIASLSFFTEGKQNITGAGGKTGSTKTTQEESSIPLIPIGDIDYNIVTATNTPADQIDNLSSMSKAIGTDPFTGVDSKTNYSLDDMRYAPSRTFLPKERREYDTAFIEKQQKIYSSTFDAIHSKLKENNKPVQMSDGSWQQKQDPAEVEAIARQDTDALLLKRRKAAKAKYDTEIEMRAAGKAVPDSKDILKNVTPEQREAYNKWHEANKDRGTATGAAGTVVIGGIQKLPKGFIEIEGELVPEMYKDYFTTLNDNIKSNFGQQEFTTTGYLLTKTDGDLTSKEIPMSHKIINDAAIARMSGGKGVYYKGQPLNAITQPDGEDGQNIKSLYKAGTNNETHDFSNGNYIPKSFYFDNIHDKWMVRGIFSTTKDGEIIKSSEYDVDVTDNMQQFMTDPQMKEIIAVDRAIDIVEGTYKGTSTVAKFGTPNSVKGEYGDIIVAVTPTGGYSIAGKVFDPIKGDVRNITEMLVEAGENPLKMTKEKVKEHLSSVFKNQMYYGEQRDNVGTTTLDIPSQLLPDANNVFNIVSKYESGGKTGEYNAMNQGGIPDPTTGRAKPVNPGNSSSILNKRIVDMTVGEVMEAQSKPSGDKGKIHAVGKYQFIPSTFKEQITKLGIHPSTKMTPALQDKLMLSYLVETVDSSSSRTALRDSLKARWEGLQLASDAELNAIIDSAYRLKAAL